MSRTLGTGRIIQTFAQPERRIAAHIPRPGPMRVCGELLDVARDGKEGAAAAARPDIGVRADVAGLLACMISISSNLSNKIWQKITIVQYQLAGEESAKAASAMPPAQAAGAPDRLSSSCQVSDP